MNQSERRKFLISELLNELPTYQSMVIPSHETEKKQLLRSLMNIRMPGAINEEFLKVQDEYLQLENERKGVKRLADLGLLLDGIYLWRGDI